MARLPRTLVAVRIAAGGVAVVAGTTGGENEPGVFFRLLRDGVEAKYLYIRVFMHFEFFFA